MDNDRLNNLCKKYTKTWCKDEEDYKNNKKKYDKFDIVYSMRSNVGTSHYITIYKQPKNIDDWDLAYIIDGYFFNVIRYGNTLECWFD